MEKVLELDRSLAGEHPDLSVRFQLDWSAMRSAHSQREIYVWRVKNAESGGNYLSEIFLNDRGVLCGCCECAANTYGTQCKHLNHCLVAYKQLEKEIVNV